MKVLTALAVGYLLGSRVSGRDLEQLTSSLKALCETEEFAGVIAVARAQLGTTLRELASVVDGHSKVPEGAGDLVSLVRHLVERA